MLLIGAENSPDLSIVFKDQAIPDLYLIFRDCTCTWSNPHAILLMGSTSIDLPSFCSCHTDGDILWMIATGLITCSADKCYKKEKVLCAEFFSFSFLPLELLVQFSRGEQPEYFCINFPFI